MALCTAAPLLICDEPTAEVDAATERDIIALLRDQLSCGTAVLVATHSDALAAATDRIVSIDDGRLVT